MILAKLMSKFYSADKTVFRLENPKVDPLSLAQGLLTSTPPQITLRPVLDQKTGEIIEYEEIFHDESLQEGDSKTSMSLNR